MMRFGLLVIVVLAIAILPAQGEEHAPPPSKQKIKALVDRLVSPNPKPITEEEDPRVAPDLRLPPGFDREKQAPVLQAHSELGKLGIQAFPILIERWEDKRYSLTTSNAWSGFYRNRAVGKVCQTIIFDQLQPYGCVQENDRFGGQPKPPCPRYPEMILFSQEAAKQWWEKHKDKNLNQMQLEALDWVIAEEAKDPKKFSDEERQYLKKLRQELKTGGKPLPPGNYLGSAT